jgi:uncharacterized membrane protein YidH (DUF202 family)
MSVQQDLVVQRTRLAKERSLLACVRTFQRFVEERRALHERAGST